MKTVLVPTDFNVESTKIIDALMQSQHEKLNIIFLHAFKLSDSVTDMLMLNYRSRDYENISDEFYAQLNHYKAKYADRLNLGIEYFYGSTVVAFKNFLEALEVACIAYPKAYNFKPINKYSIDPKFLTGRSGCETMELDIIEHEVNENLIETKMHERTLQNTNV
ncbi:hypothetical protein [Pedobacter endophyticus]|uniref:Universal stress protein family protein n=1 Tax=Pedobacter endophyticus TaxID=2789740 RepID=A0A7S9PZ34_9SPHI|nr:hypothetical protein [Pedobacter endophyticus]QPH39217.1 hypothetical protein IZT61_19535 [Pedobacter endophyticus]